ncbi:cyclopropane-fatty-acyl-phospholipid synthase family protein [Thalassomonas sp. RHCl1]|uniref:SAM-dependent methyltransferase n=1 Tax=Thalassomonas sp. RHCl1 TaxID=2995320 RepID=UPI00248AC57E|nr:cyclopropane-fatty-acyl-phospholipid synthase family protein [Thalassomonas sp. RHCl1]
MENLVEIAIKGKSGWFEQRCRNLVFKVLKQINDGSLEVIEGHNKTQFGQSAGQIAPGDNGQELSAKLVVHDPSTYRDLVLKGSIGAGEAYIAGKWSSPDLTAVIRIFARAQQMTDQLESGKNWFKGIQQALLHWANRNSKAGAQKNIAAHYDLGNELYSRFLDPQMIYSSAIYPKPQASLSQAQYHKLETICQRLELKEDDHLLEIGSGWGGLAIYAALYYGCKVTTTTISREQYQYARKQIDKLGLGGQITLLQKDYRELSGQYDKLVSIEMIEAVGYDYLESFFRQCNLRLKSGGKMLLQSITIADQRFDYYRNNVDFIQCYIFPGGFLPSITEIARRTQIHTDMVIEKIDDIGLHYAKTLAHWREQFLDSWRELTELGYDESFKRLWLYYFGYCEGAFLERAISTVQVVFRK